MRVFKNKSFSKWAEKSGLHDASLWNAVVDIEAGLIDAELGGHIFKKRIASANKGKRSSYRTIVAFKHNERAFFMFGFNKSDRSNISSEELRALKRLAKELFDYSDLEIQSALKHGILIEVKNNG